MLCNLSYIRLSDKLYLKYIFGAIEKPETVEESVNILCEWLRNIGLDFLAVPTKPVDIDYNEFINEVTSAVAYPFNNKIKGYATAICLDNFNMGYFFYKEYANSLLNWTEDALYDIYNKGFLPDINKFTFTLIGTKNPKLLKDFLNFDLILSVAPICTLKKLIRLFGESFILTQYKQNPSKLFNLILKINDLNWNNIVYNENIVGQNINYNNLCSIVEELDHSLKTPKIKELYNKWIGDDNFESNPAYTNKYKITSNIKQEFEDICRMIQTNSKENIMLYNKIINDYEKYATSPNNIELINKFIFNCKKLIYIKPQNIKSLDEIKYWHDWAIRYSQTVRYTRRRILNEPYKKFPPPIKPDAPPLIEYIDNEEDLEWEGEFMHHCVGAYVEECANGESFIYKYNGYERGTIELDENGTLKQFYGKHDSGMPEKDKEIVQTWIDDKDILKYIKEKKIDSPSFQEENIEKQQSQLQTMSSFLKKKCLNYW